MLIENCKGKCNKNREKNLEDLGNLRGISETPGNVY